jgi:hypothetical protein
MAKGGIKPQPAQMSAFADEVAVKLSAKADICAGCGFMPPFAA